MKLNFFMEISGFVICILLCFATSARYNLIDLKDRLYVRMTHVVTVFSAANILSYVIIRNNIFELRPIAYIGIYMSFWLLVWILYYMTLYFQESMNRKNSISAYEYIIYGLTSFANFISLVINWGKHFIFDLCKIDSNLQVVFNSFYVVPYILAGISLFVLTLHIIKFRHTILQTNQKIFFLIPVLFVFAYYLQFRFKAVATFGFSCSIILLLLYLYSYNYNEKIDHLTNLPNEHSFKKMIDYRIGNGQHMHVIMVTLNDFKHVNREYGYGNGNDFIKAIGDYLSSISPRNCVARYGGDQFGIILDGESEDVLENWTTEVINRFREPWQINKLKLQIAVSVVAVTYPEMGNSTGEIEELLAYLNQIAKKQKQSQVIVCDDVYKEKMIRKTQITSILKEVISGGNMFVEYQPIYDPRDNAYTKGEALFRLKDPVLNDISPAEFFPIAEENGYVIDIGYVLVDKVCQYIKSFMDAGEKPPVISVNFSRQQLMAENVGEKLLSILGKYDLQPEAIAIELPEEVFAVQYEDVKQSFNRLYNMGFHFYLDGFGTGFLDLSHLMELPFDLIKINKGMIRDAEQDDTIYLLVSAMTAVFEENGKMILGDGIESERLKEITDMLFMDYMQGYYFSAPVSDEEARSLFLQKDIFERKENDIQGTDEDIEDILASINEEFDGEEDNV